MNPSRVAAGSAARWQRATPPDSPQTSKQIKSNQIKWNEMKRNENIICGWRWRSNQSTWQRCKLSNSNKQPRKWKPDQIVINTNIGKMKRNGVQLDFGWLKTARCVSLAGHSCWPAGVVIRVFLLTKELKLLLLKVKERFETGCAVPIVFSPTQEK